MNRPGLRSRPSALASGPRTASTLAVSGALLLGTATGCAQQYRDVDESKAAPQAPSTATVVATPRAPRSAAANAADDLRAGSAERVFRSGALTVNVTYSTPLPTTRWMPSVSKPVHVSLSAFNNSDDKQKVYLSKVTLAVTSFDGNGPIGNPGLLTDSANINPGYLVNFPYTYSQNFTVPALDEGALSVTLTFNYEFLCLVSDGGKDYVKQTGSSTISVPLR